MNNTSTCPDTDSDFLKCAKPKSREFIRELAFLQCCSFFKVQTLFACHAGMAMGMEDFKTSTCIAVISDRHLSPPTLCIYPALATRHGSCNRHEPACQIGGKLHLPRERN